MAIVVHAKSGGGWASNVSYPDGHRLLALSKQAPVEFAIPWALDQMHGLPVWAADLGCGRVPLNGGGDLRHLLAMIRSA